MNKTKTIFILGVVVIVLFAAFLTVKNSVLKSNLGSGMALPGFQNEPSEIAADSFVRNGKAKALPRETAGIALDEVFYPEETVPSYEEANIDKKVIKNGNLTLKVNSVDQSAEEVGQIAKNNGGDVFSSNFYKNNQGAKSGTITVKIPVADFEKTFNEIKKVAAVVTRESISGVDVTEEYQDLEIQIKNKQAEEEAYKKILASAQKVEDILAITEQLSMVRGEVESFQGRLKYLSFQTDMATISISLSEEMGITVSDFWRPGQVAKEAVNSLIQKSQGFVNFIIVLIITIIPVALLYFLLLWILYWAGKKAYFKFKRKREMEKAGSI